VEGGAISDAVGGKWATTHYDDCPTQRIGSSSA
jgi:hypothetical protein